MRDDLRVDFFWLSLLVIVTMTAVGSALRRGTDGPNWELRWRGLDPDDRARISVAARSRDWKAAQEALGPEEKELAIGLKRRDRRRTAYAELVLLSFSIVAGALALAGVIEWGLAGFILTTGVLLSSGWGHLRVRQMSGGPRPVTAPDPGL